LAGSDLVGARTGALALIGIRLPRDRVFQPAGRSGLSQELGAREDDPARADPPTVSGLFGAIRRNYFRLYLNSCIQIGRIVYCRRRHLPYILLEPTIIVADHTRSMNRS